MPKYTVLAEAYVRFETEASTPEEAKRAWETRLKDRTEFRLNEGVLITLRYPEIAVVLSENRRQG